MKIKEITEILVEKASMIVSEEDAKYFADECLETHIRKFPRSNHLASAISDLRASLQDKNAKIEYVVDLPSYFAIDFKGKGPLVYMKQIHDELEARSAKTGMAMVAFKNSKSMHTLHAWVQGLAKKGMLAIAVCNGGPNAVVPYNGHRGVMGTNPIAYGFQGEDSQIYCVDMATSDAPYFEIMDAYKDKKPLREGIAVDFEGNPTTDADKALDFSRSKVDPYANLLPMGGSYKGYYMAFLMEMLTSALIGMPSAPEMTPDFIAEEHGAIIIAFSPKAMGSADSFIKTVNALKSAIVAQDNEFGKEVRFPGADNNNKFSTFAATELELDSKTMEKLLSLKSLI